ncbi:MAG: ABC transporter ATP-binding protein [Planctomycetia bacterium]|nr:ABC transporter ATP-binding protein [Planctomycetia bacterium]
MVTALELNHVWKKFHRGEFHDSLRDAIPALVKSCVGLGSQKSELAEKDFWALQDIDFKVEEGERLGFIGHNGAGKSTLLKILSNIIAPNRGSMRVHGKLRALIEIGAGFHGDLTGKENIYLNGAILGMTKKEIDRNFDSIVDFSGIEAFLNMPVKRYSSGMAARLGFAVAAHLDPDILIVDEVLSVGDIQFQKKCLGKMNEVANSGRTVLFVSHNISAIRQLCHRSILLDHGKTLADGPTDEVIKQYLGMTESQSKLSLAERTNREGNGNARVTAILSGSNLSDLSPSGFTDMGGSLYIRVKYDCIREITHPVIAVSIWNMTGEILLLNMTTSLTEKIPRPLRGQGYVDFQIPFQPLVTGEYLFSVGIYERENDETRRLIIVDHILNAGNMTVYEAPFQPMSAIRTPPGVCVAPFTWCQSNDS